jgi:DNA-binding winged helix-turn-helix (wHTH) protein/tetratricopeptide (TPR) repeat protein
MVTTIYQFGDFSLHPRSRELRRNGELLELPASGFDCLVYLLEHRERPVGKDELIAAVWGRTEVSESLLAQTIVRLRRALGDTGTEQRCIKTVPRVGYRWIADTKIISNGVGDMMQPPAPGDGGIGAQSASDKPVTRSPWRRQLLWITPLLLMLIAVAGYWSWHASGPQPLPFNQGTTIVLPAEIDAPEDWKWLRLGLMDLISSDLREARIPVESSQTVLDLLDQKDTEAQSRLASFTWTIHPRVTQSGNVWTVHLKATNPDGRVWQAEASADNVMTTAHSANYLLLAQMGAAQPARPASSDARQQYVMRINAAALAGSTDAEQALIDNAPAEVKNTPEFEYAKSAFYCDQGMYEPCKQGLADLLQRLPAGTQPSLRGQALAHQWYVYYREHNYTQGENVLGQAIKLLQKQPDAGPLAFAYAQRAELEQIDGKFDQAASDFGLARVNYTLSGDTAGAYGIDESLADLSMQRGRFKQAIPTIQRAYEQYQQAGMRQFMPPLLQDLVMAQKLLLQHSDELATTDRYWPFEQKHWQITEDVTRHMLTYARALALADNGRTADASHLLEQMLAEVKLDAKGEPGVQAVTEVLLARLALERGDTQTAETWISKVLAEQVLERDYDKRDYAQAWLVKVMVMQQGGKQEELKRTVTAMQTWAAALPEQSEWIDILTMRAQAVEAWSEGRHDQALSLLQQAISKADDLGVPELIVDVGQAYTHALLGAGKLNEAVAISGQLATWGQLDWRAAWAQAAVYRGLGQSLPWEQYREKATALAGDRMLKPDASVFIY